MKTNFRNKNNRIASLFIITVKATRKWPGCWLIHRLNRNYNITIVRSRKCWSSSFVLQGIVRQPTNQNPLPKLVIWNIYGPCMGMIWDEIWAIYGDDMVLIWVMLFHMKPIEAHCPHSFANLLS